MSTSPEATAFPITSDAMQFSNLSGLTKREWFAGMAISGLAGGEPYMNRDHAALKAVELADFLIAALNKEPQA